MRPQHKQEYITNLSTYAYFIVMYSTERARQRCDDVTTFRVGTHVTNKCSTTVVAVNMYVCMSCLLAPVCLLVWAASANKKSAIDNATIVEKKVGSSTEA